MISSVRGVVLSARGQTAVIDVGGIGYSITVAPGHAQSLTEGHEAFIVTTLVVREDSMTLFGFPDTDHLDVFDLLRTVSGVGPKSAMGVLAVLDPSQIAAAVASEDDSVFRKVSGIGPKTAKLIVVSLTGKLHASNYAAAAQPNAAPLGIGDSVVAALVGLGWSERQAEDAVTDALGMATEAERSTVSALLRLTLSGLGRTPASSTR
ncbi:Holliday junction branch migration protein RuvA [Homoserinimonas sp. OAct 916]|uniref:Holliday junction branch migration protein RuvA n=1 Tax=Homoserinimonas sp. OAct 916 TaxID=2211450 RepID=UPI000DBE571A|nr:Holliday junction branch migration protein RuvA [Homoserinimonas sp. OAct 916]